MIYRMFDQDTFLVAVKGDFMESNLNGVVTLYDVGDAIAVFNLLPGQMVIGEEDEEDEDLFGFAEDEDEDDPSCPEGCPDCAADAALLAQQKADLAEKAPNSKQL